MAIPNSEGSHIRSTPPSPFTIHASFAEKSVWIQLISLTLGLGLYVVVAGSMLRGGTDVLIAYMPVFVVAVLFIVAVNVVGHIAVAIASRPNGPDERDRLIGWRAESNCSWILGASVIAAIGGMIAGVGEVWVAHLLLLSLFVAEVVKDIIQLVYYRRGMSL